MCSDPNIQISKETGETLVFACRKCDQCLAARQNDWVARACAESHMAKETMAVHLTYRDKADGTAPDGARAFKYSDVQIFLKRLRDQVSREYSRSGLIRYAAVGERGSQKDRVHWHLLIWGAKEFSHLGHWFHLARDMQSAGLRAKGPSLDEKMIWSLWDHGFVELQRPDEGGIRYVMKYILKDQFSARKSAGTAREHKADNSAAGIFRMTKLPPLGQPLLDRLIGEWHQRRVVPVSLQIRIPGYGGYWWPKGPLRERLLYALHDINADIRRATGHDARQWKALMATITNPDDWETLEYGKIEQTEAQRLSPEADISEPGRARELSSYRRRLAPAIIEACAKPAPCWKCFDRLDPDGKRRARQVAKHRRENEDASCNPFCRFRKKPAWIAAFNNQRAKNRG